MAKGRRRHDLVWQPTRLPLTTRLREGASRWFSFVAAPAPVTGVARALLEAGIPVLAALEDRQDPTALATSLLDVAAELEHALMIEYLYAAYSVDDPGVAQVIGTIAAQEMGHLATVQNLRLAMGLPIYLGRQDLDPQPAQDPFVFRLEPVSLDSLAKYVATEMPDEVPDALKATVDEILVRATAAAGSAVNRIGTIYATLYWLFLPTDATGTKPWPDFPEKFFRDNKVPQLATLQPTSVTYQAEPVEWRAATRQLHIVLCDSGAAALQALFRIAAQGEGLAQDPDSHFLKFVGLYTRMRDVGLVVRDVPVDPHTGTGPADSKITDPTSLAVSAVLDAAYAALQIEVLVSLSLDRAGPKANARRALITHLLSDMMVGTLAPLALRLAITLPREAGQAESDTRRPGAVFAACPVTGGSLALLLSHWKTAIDDLEARMNDALAAPDPTGLVAGDLATVGDDIVFKRQLLAQISAP